MNWTLVADINMLSKLRHKAATGTSFCKHVSMPSLITIANELCSISCVTGGDGASSLRAFYPE